MGALTGLFQDALVLENDEIKLTKTTLGSSKIRGVVCSENKSAPSPNSDDGLKATCNNSLESLK